MTPTQSAPRHALRLTGLSKVYPPNVTALTGVDLELQAGEIRALVGMNGAGKSTLIKILAGNESPTSGTIEVSPHVVNFRGPKDAGAAGIGVVHQELPLLANLTAAENMALGVADGSLLAQARRKELNARYEEVAARVPGAPAAAAKLDELDIDSWQLVAIVRALGSGARILVLDEPTSSLSFTERDTLHANLRRVSDEGVGIIYVSHALDDVLDIADTVTVLRDGRVVHNGPTAGLTTGSLLTLMAGEAAGISATATEREQPAPNGDAALTVRALISGSVGPVDLSVGAGECVGLYGLMGCGATELLEALLGIHKHTGFAAWSGLPLEGPPSKRMKAGVRFVSGNRPHTVIAEWSVAMNHSLSRLSGRGFLSPLSTAGERSAAERTVQQFSVVGGVDRPMRTLSGGNQQKVLIGRCVADAASCLLADEPSRGVDAHARQAIHNSLRQLLAAGGSLLVHTSEPDELVALCDRVLILADGHIVGELTGSDITVTALETATAVSSHPHSEPLSLGRHS
jgi:ABC-type sugar transport system ATPase subunit